MIHVEFKDFQDMLSFAGQLLGQVEGEKAMQPQSQSVTQQAPVMPMQNVMPTTPVMPVQNAVPIAPAMPAQSVPTVPTTPVQSTAPVVPTQPTAPTAPTQTATPVAPAQPAVPTSSVTYTPDDLARAAFVLMDSGRQQELIGLLQQFGVNAIPELKPDQFGAFATALRGMGAQI